MKIIKKIILFVLTLILLDLSLALMINCTFKYIIVKDILIESLKSNNENITSNIQNEELVKSNNEILYEILQDKKVQDIANEYLEEIIDILSTEEDIELDTQDIQKEVIEYLKNNKEELSKKVGINITDEMIDQAEKQMNDIDTKKSLEQQISNAKNNMPKEGKKLLKVYKFVVSEKLRIILIVSMIIDILLIILLKHSYYKWLKSTSIAIISSGLVSLMSSLLIKLVIGHFTTVSIKVSTLQIAGLTTLVIGILLFIIYFIINNVNKEKTNEISKVS